MRFLTAISSKVPYIVYMEDVNISPSQQKRIKIGDLK